MRGQALYISVVLEHHELGNDSYSLQVDREGPKNLEGEWKCVATYRFRYLKHFKLLVPNECQDQAGDHNVVQRECILVLRVGSLVLDHDVVNLLGQKLS